jgi:hypothetical protein
MSGSVTANQPSHYGSKTFSNPANIPCSRAGSIGWKDNNGNLWLFGGAIYNTAGGINDLWRFVPDTTCPHIACAGLGIKETSLNKNEINIYPAPVTSTSILKIESTIVGKVKVRFYDVLGQNILSKESENHTIPINRKDFNTGMFFYQAFIGEEIIGSGKFIVI